MIQLQQLLQLLQLLQYNCNYYNYYNYYNTTTTTTTTKITTTTTIQLQLLQLLQLLQYNYNYYNTTTVLLMLLRRLSLQLLNERLMGAEGTKMDEDFLKMEKVKLWIPLLVQKPPSDPDWLSVPPSVPPSVPLSECRSDPLSAGGAAVQNYRVPPTKPRYEKTVLSSPSVKRVDRILKYSICCSDDPTWLFNSDVFKFFI